MNVGDIQLKEDVRAFTDIDETVMSDEELDTILSDAKRHIQLRTGLRSSDLDWYNDPAQEEALSWATKLFMLVSVGELDRNTIQAGAIDHQTLHSKGERRATIWYRNMEKAIRNINPGTAFGVRSVARSDREYGSDGEEDTSGGLSL